MREVEGGIVVEVEGGILAEVGEGIEEEVAVVGIADHGLRDWTRQGRRWYQSLPPYHHT